MRIRPAAALSVLLLAAPGLSACGDENLDERATPRADAIQRGAQVIPLYPVSGDGDASKIGFDQSGSTLRAVDQNGEELWSASSPVKLRRVYGGFDYDQDGWPDVATVASKPTGRQCGSVRVMSRHIVVFSGSSGKQTEPVRPLPDYCSSNGVAVKRWSQLAPLFGSGPDLAFAPQYLDGGRFLRFEDGAWRKGPRFYQPTGPWWERAYGTPANLDCRHDLTNAACVESHAPNGLVMEIDGEPRMIAWTTRHVLQLRMDEPLGRSQLVGSHSYVSHCRPPVRVCDPPDVAGRNYGLVTRDPESGRVILLSGTSAFSVFSDLKAGYYPSPRGDPFGGFEWHVSIYDPAEPDAIDTRPYGYANAFLPEANRYRGRLVYPANPLVHTGEGASRLAYSVYSEEGEEPGHWSLQITAPGSTSVETKVRDRFLWDVRDVDGDGTDEWITSPARESGGDSYLPIRRTEILRWDEKAERLDEEEAIDGVYPYLTRGFRRPETSTSQSFLFPALSVETEEGPRLLVTTDGVNPEPAP